jgi:hypothetical protein
MMRARRPWLTAVRRSARALAYLIVRIGSALAEINYQQRRLSAIRQSYDWYLGNPFEAPDTYAEFLLRTGGVLRHEPSARQRLSGQAVH